MQPARVRYSTFMRWWFIAVDALVAALVAWLLLNLLASMLRACGLKWARLPNLDWLGQWLALAFGLLTIAPRFDWNDPVDRYFIEGYGALCLLIVAMSVYGRLFVLPKVANRPLEPRTPPADLITTGLFQGWSARVVRGFWIALTVFALAGSASGELFLHGQTILGTLAAAIALYCTPQVIATPLALWVRSIIRAQ